MTEPTGFDPFSVFVQILGVLTGPSSLIVWIVVIVNSIIGWVVLGSRVARLSKEAADRIVAQKSRIPALLVVVVIQTLFLATGTMIAIQWGVVQQLDQNLDTPSFVGADFEIGRQSLFFWVIMLYNLAMLLIAWSDEFMLIFGGLGFLWVGRESPTECGHRSPDLCPVCDCILDFVALSGGAVGRVKKRQRPATVRPRFEGPYMTVSNRACARLLTRWGLHRRLAQSCRVAGCDSKFLDKRRDVADEVHHLVGAV